MLHRAGLGHDGVDLARELVVRLGQLLGLAALDLRELVLEHLLAQDLAVADVALATRDLLVDLLVQQLDGVLPRVRVHLGDHVLREVDHALQRARGDVQQQAEPARDALREPDVRDGRREADVPHALAADLRPCDFNAALVADDALVADALVLPAVALEVLLRAEDLLAEEPVLLRLERAVVDRFRLGHLAVRPRADLRRRSERQSDGVEVVDLKH